MKIRWHILLAHFVSTIICSRILEMKNRYKNCQNDEIFHSQIVLASFALFWAIHFFVCHCIRRLWHAPNIVELWKLMILFPFAFDLQRKKKFSVPFISCFAVFSWQFKKLFVVTLAFKLAETKSHRTFILTYTFKFYKCINMLKAIWMLYSSFLYDLD